LKRFVSVVDIYKGIKGTHLLIMHCNYANNNGYVSTNEITNEICKMGKDTFEDLVYILPEYLFTFVYIQGGTI